MSILFGVRNPIGAGVSEQSLLALAQATARWAPDGTALRVVGQIGMGFQAFHTHARSRLESQPVVSDCGDVITFDGRLDNHQELRAQLELSATNPSDSQIVLSAFERWGEECFSKLVGDWALAIWAERDRTLYLARDHAGTRSLYYAEHDHCVLWGTFLETLTSQVGDPLDSEYIRSYLACQPSESLTPYRSIRAVRPAEFVRIRLDGITEQPHWQSLVSDTIRYQSDADYEHHFRDLFRQAVERRTGEGARILAHLSGGMDSSSIVCMSDSIRKEQGASPDDLLDTISYFDSSEPHWNEKPYVSIVEERRAKTGIHIPATTTDRTLDLVPRQYLLPGPDGSTQLREQSLMATIGDAGYRVILSGAGGDECFGGVATCLPELADLLAARKAGPLLRSALAWALAARQPLIKILADSTLCAYRSYAGTDEDQPLPPVPWLQGATKAPPRHPVGPETSGLKRYSYRPSAIQNAAMWEPLTESLPQTCRSLLLRFEYRYPCLDRDLVDFVFRIPREQLVRPGRRRSLMRRAMLGIVPVEVIERRRKAYIVRGPIQWFENHYEKIDLLFERSLLAEMQLIDSRKLRECVRGMVTDRDYRLLPYINRAIALDIWLQSRNREASLPAAT